MSRIGKKPVVVPKGRDRDRRRVDDQRQRPARRAGPTGPSGDGGRRPGCEVVVSRPSDEAEHKALHGLTRTLVANMVEGVTTGFKKQLGDRRRRLQGRGPTVRVAARTRDSRIRSTIGRLRASSCRRRSRRRSSSRVRTRKSWDRSRPSCGACAPRSRTRGRASSTLVSRSVGRRARPEAK